MTPLHTIILTRQQFSIASPSVHEYEIRYWKSISFAFYIYTVSSGYALGRQTAGVKLYCRQQSYLSNFL